MPGQCPSTVRESLWQTPHASMRTRTCPGPGSGTSRSTSSNCLFGPGTWKARDPAMDTPTRNYAARSRRIRFDQDVFLFSQNASLYPARRNWFFDHRLSEDPE